MRTPSRLRLLLGFVLALAAFGPIEAHAPAPKRRLLAGHSNQVVSVAFSPDGLTVASGAFDNTARLWDARTGRELAELSPVRSQELQQAVFVAFAPDGGRLATAAWGGPILHDAATGVALSSLELQPHPFEYVAFSPDGRTVAAGSGSSTYLYDASSGRILGTLSDGPRGRAGRCGSFSPDGSILATPGREGRIILWDLGAMEKASVLSGHPRGVQALAFSPDGRLLASASADPRDTVIRLWDARSGRPVSRLRGSFSAAISSLAFSPDGRTMALGVNEADPKARRHKACAVHLVDIRTGRAGTTMRCAGVVFSIALSQDGRRLAAGAGKLVYLYELGREAGLHRRAR